MILTLSELEKWGGSTVKPLTNFSSIPVSSLLYLYGKVFIINCPAINLVQSTEKSKKAVKSAGNKIAQKPMKSMVLAFTAGFVLAKIFNFGNESSD